MSVWSMRRSVKIFTLLISLMTFSGLQASILKTERTKQYFRIKVNTQKSFLRVSRVKDKIFLKTLNTELASNLEQDFKALQYDQKLIKSIKSSQDGNIFVLEIALSDADIDSFDFYQEQEKYFAIDLWSKAIADDKVLGAQQKPVIKDEPLVAKKKVKSAPQKAPVKKKVQKVSKNKSLLKSSKSVVRTKKKLNYLDFRYGAAFVWDYDPLLPEHESAILLSRKTPEYFYPIKNRDYEKSEDEAHLQIAINFFREKKFGLMHKSLDMYVEKYGDKKNSEIIEYIRAIAILNGNLKAGELKPVKAAIVMLENVGKKTKDYELKKATFRYLQTYYDQEGDTVTALVYAKRLYVVSKENYDYEQSKLSVEKILSYIAKLNQIDHLKNLAVDKTISKLIQGQKIDAYKSYALLSTNKTTELIDLYKRNRKSYAKPIHESLLFNTAEAHFREGQYTQSIKLFDEFLKHYSYHAFSERARLRIALAYELSGKNIKQTINLYKNAINRASQQLVQYEAKLRYVGLKYLRKVKPTKSDKEVIVFLNRKSTETEKLSPDLEQLLWLVRLRAYVKDQDYDTALTYLRALPLKTIARVRERAFIADGSEIISGFIEKKFNEGREHIVVRLWEVYAKDYIQKVALDPYLNYIVGKSYLSLGFFDSFEKLHNNFSKLENNPPKTYPNWRNKERSIDVRSLAVELRVLFHIRKKEWSKAKQTNETKFKSNPKFTLYKGIIDYHLGEFKSASDSLDTFVTSDNEVKLAENELALFYEAYAGSLYELKDVEKYQKVTRAILSDTKNLSKEKKVLGKVLERIYYLYLENLTRKGSTESFMSLEASSKQYLDLFDQSIYSPKVKYLLGIAYSKNKKIDDAKKVFDELINAPTISKNIKELARTELTLINLNNRRL
ncbi:MAG: tetratricopeptide repeat protein [Bacteriovoracaceae bacterium]